MNGSPIPSQRIHEDVYFALTIPQGKWLYGTPGQGSRLHELIGVKRTEKTERIFSTLAMNAIQRQIIDTGKASQALISTVESGQFGISNQIEVEPQMKDFASILNFRSV